MRPALVLALALFLCGCGGGREEHGTASLWITRDRGAEVLVEREVPAGLTVLDALRRHADVETRYGGRFVQAINGLTGSSGGGVDWFYFVNGVAADRSAAEYRLHDGDVAWWDYRRWVGEREVAIVVGAFPEPFVHGYGGQRRPAAVRYADATQAPVARRLARVIGADSVADESRVVPSGWNVLYVRHGRRGWFDAATRSPDGPYTFVVGGPYAARLASRPSLARFRYRGLP